MAALTSVAVKAGETVRLRFRAQSPSGEVIRPPATAAVHVTGQYEFFVAMQPFPDPEWDGRQWTLAVDTGDWPLGEYTVTAEVVSAGGARGLAEAGITVYGS